MSSSSCLFNVAFHSTDCAILSTVFARVAPEAEFGYCDLRRRLWRRADQMAKIKSSGMPTWARICPGVQPVVTLTHAVRRAILLEIWRALLTCGRWDNGTPLASPRFWDNSHPRRLYSLKASCQHQWLLASISVR